jgi:hypothetical protein
MNVLVSAGIPVRTVTYKILHDKVIVADKRNTESGLSISAGLRTVRIQRMCWLCGMTRRRPTLPAALAIRGMSELTGVHRTNDHTAHNFSAPTEKMYFTLN